LAGSKPYPESLTDFEEVFPLRSDIEIAQAAQMKPIDQIATEFGILPEEVEMLRLL